MLELIFDRLICRHPVHAAARSVLQGNSDTVQFTNNDKGTSDMISKSWEHLFSRHILKRGRSYFYSNRVRGLRYHEDTDSLVFNASVSGSHLYKVEGVFENDYLQEISCTCPYGETDYCKHMAAVIYSLEYNLEIERDRLQRKKAEEEKKKRINARKQCFPFRTPEGKDPYFNLEKITSSLKIYDLDYQDALMQLGSSDQDFSIDFIYKPDDGYKGMLCTAALGRSTILFSRDSIHRLECCNYGCPGYTYSYYSSFEKQRTACIHELMLLIMVNRYLSSHDVGDSTDYNAFRFLRNMRSDTLRQTIPENDQGNPGVRLVPKITQNHESISLSFRIGREKLYAVKNLRKLTEAVAGNMEYDLGKNSVLSFLTDSFDEQSMKYYRFIQGCVNEHKALVENAARSYSIPDIGTGVELTGSGLDTIFELTLGHEAEYINKAAGNKAKPLILSERDPQIRLSIRKDTENDTFFGITLNGRIPAFFQGVSHQYFLEENEKQAFLYRVSEEAAAQIELIRNLGVSGNISMSIGKKHLSEFYYDVLPVLQESMIIDEPDAGYIESMMPPKAEFIIYLDAADKVPVLKIETVYDDRIIPASDMLKNTQTPADFDPLRDPYRESQALDMVLRYFDFYDESTDSFHMDDDPRKIYLLLNSGLREFSSFCRVQSTDRFDSLRSRSISKVKVGVSIQSDLMNLTISSGDLTPEELLEILRSYKLKEKYHRLPSGIFIDLDENVAQLSAMMDALHLTPKQFISGKINVPAYRALYLDKMLESLNGIQISRDRYFRELIKNFKAVSESDFEPPESLSDILRPYQIYGYQWLRTLASCNFAGILADDMGLGKTIQMISVLLAVKDEGSSGTSLIICPASLVYNWAEEFNRFAPVLNVGIVSGSRQERQALLENYKQYDVLITSYDLLKRDVPYYEEKQFEYQVLDEAQFIKTHTTAAAKSVKIINSRHRFALTGTPIENRLSELWSIFDYLMPGFLYGYDTFRKDFETPVVKNEDAAASAQLKRMVSPFILRRLKKDVLKDLPEKLEEVRYARFDTDQQKLYDAQIVRLKGMIDKSDDSQLNQNRIAILAELTRTRQICCDPSLLFEDYQGCSAKKEACLDLVQSAVQGEHRVLLFSQFTSMLAILEEEFRKEGIEYFKITGSTPKQERVRLVREFNEGSVPLFLISLKAGGTGLNLTGADIVIHYDPWWNIAAQNQATDRAHRIGQTREVCVFKLIVRGTIEEKIMNMQDKKEKLADEILNGETAGISGMTKQELLELLTV